MKLSADCTWARRAFPDLLEGSRPSPVAAHVAGCPACARAFEEFRTIVGDLGAIGAQDVPDPGAAYWERFTVSVHDRLAVRARNRTLAGGAWPLAAAAALLAVVAFVAIIWSPATRRTQWSISAIRSRVDRAFENLRDLPPEQAWSAASLAVGAATATPAAFDPVPRIGPREVLDALDAMRDPVDIDWWSIDLQDRLDSLDEREMSRLRADLLGNPS